MGKIQPLFAEQRQSYKLTTLDLYDFILTAFYSQHTHPNERDKIERSIL
jgi:hypothetical protein